MEGFAEPHVVGKHCSNATARHPVQPVDAAALVLAQLRMHSRRNLHALRGDLIHPAEQRRVPSAAGELDGLLGHGLQRQLAQLGHGDLLVLLAALVEFLAAALHVRHQSFPPWLVELLSHLCGGC